MCFPFSLSLSLSLFLSLSPSCALCASRSAFIDKKQQRIVPVEVVTVVAFAAVVVVLVVVAFARPIVPATRVHVARCKKKRL